MGGVSAPIVLLLALCVIGVKNHDQQEVLQHHRIQPKQKLLLIMVDGARWDYINETYIKSLSGFLRLATEGVKAEFNAPIYPANSYPNWYTITTGLHAESHGFVDNIMYDTVYNEYFEMAPDPKASESHWWNQTEPIWIRAERSGVRTAMWNWDGCQVNFNGTSATFCRNYTPIWDTVKEDTILAADQILDGLKNDSYGLGMVYFEPVDENGHAYGPLSPQCQEAVRNASDVLEAIQDRIVAKGLSNRLNVYVVSDHGMAQPDKFIYLNKYMNFSDVYAITGGGPIFTILPTNQRATVRIYDNLKHANVTGLYVYLKQNVPDKLHWKHSRLIHQIVLRSAPGYRIDASSDDPRFANFKWTKKDNRVGGLHGYFVDEWELMRGIMLAKGPAFKTGFQQTPVKQLDHYNVFCHILGLQPHPNNGSWDRVKDMLNA